MSKDDKKSEEETWKFDPEKARKAKKVAISRIMAESERAKIEELKKKIIQLEEKCKQVEQEKEEEILEKLQIRSELNDIKRKIAEEELLAYKKNFEEGGLNVTCLNSRSKTIIEDIKQEFEKNKEIIIFDDIIPLMDNKKFIDLMIEKKVPFKSLVNEQYSVLYSNALLYISDNRGLRKAGNPTAGKHFSKQAVEFSKRMGPIFDELDELGINSVRAKSDELNKRDIRTFKGHKWSFSLVQRAYTRWKKIKAEEEQNENSASFNKTPKPE